MNILSSFSFLKQYFYKIYQDCVLLTIDKSQSYVICGLVKLKIENWLTFLKKINCNKSSVMIEIMLLIDEIEMILSKKEIPIFKLWDIQNKIDIIIKNKEIWKK